MFSAIKERWAEAHKRAMYEDPLYYKENHPEEFAQWLKETPNAEQRVAEAIREKEAAEKAKAREAAEKAKREAEERAAAIEYNKKIHGKGYQVVSGRLLDHFSEDNLDRLYRTFAPELSAAIERAGKMPDYIDKIEYKGLYEELARQYDAVSKHYEVLQKRYNTLCQKLGKYEDVPYELEEVEVKEEPKQPEKKQERGGGR